MSGINKMNTPSILSGGVFAKKMGANLYIFDISDTGDVSQTLVTTEGGVQRSLQDRFEDVINVKDFGAKGDGITDDTLALQTAMDIAVLRRCPLVLDGGDYLITSHLVVNPQNPVSDIDTLIGNLPGPLNAQSLHYDVLTIEAYGGARIVAGAEMDEMLLCKNIVGNENGLQCVQYLRITDLILDGDNNARKGIELNWSYRASFDRVRIFDVKTGINNSHSAVNLFSHCIISAEDCCISLPIAGDIKIMCCDFYVRDVGINMGGGSDTQITNCLFTGDNFVGDAESTTRIGIKLMGYAEGDTDHRSRTIVVNGNEFIGLDYCVYGVDDDGDSIREIWGIAIDGNHTIRNQYRPNIALVYLKNAAHCTIVNNSCGDMVNVYSNANEIYLNSCRAIVVSKNCFLKYKQSVISTTATQRCSIDGNIFVNALSYDADVNTVTTPVISLGGSYNSICNNVTAKEGSPGTITHVFIEELSGSTGNLIKNNVLLDDYTQPYIIVGGTTDARREVFSGSAPVSGTWNRGDMVWNKSPATGGGILCWVCTAAGTPGTWVSIKMNTYTTQ